MFTDWSEIASERKWNAAELLNKSMDLSYKQKLFFLFLRNIDMAIDFASGLNVNKIAKKYGITHQTVRMNIFKIQKKLEMRKLAKGIYSGSIKKINYDSNMMAALRIYRFKIENKIWMR